MKDKMYLIKRVGAMSLMLMLLVNVVGAQTLLIDVGEPGGYILSINNAIGQSFKLDSCADLTAISIWIWPELYWLTSYHVELHDGEGPSGPVIGSTPTMAIDPQSAGGLAGYYDFELTTPVTLHINHTCTFVLVRDSLYSGGFAENANVYPGGIEYWVGSYPEPYHDITFQVYGFPLSNQRPVAHAGGPYSAVVGTPITLDASGSSDPDGDPLQFRWDFTSDGSWDTPLSDSPTVTHTYSQHGTYTATVEVTDGVCKATATAVVDIAADDTLLIDVGATGGNVAINNVIGQSFKVDSCADLTRISIWIRPELYYITAYHVELHDGEGPSGQVIGTTTMITINPLDPPWYLGVEPGVPAYYDLQFSTTVALEADHAYTFVLKSDPADNGPNGWTNYSGAFTRNSNVYPDGILYWIGEYPQPLYDMTFRVYGYLAPTNVTPTVTATNPVVQVGEGQTAANTGTYADADAADIVILTASVGSITKTGTNDGTWSWTFNTTDGPDQSQNVTITADDQNGGVSTTTFELIVDNIAPEGGPIIVDQTVVVVGTTVNASVEFSDPGVTDTHVATCDWGDGTSHTFDPASSPVSDSYAYSAAGVYTLTMTVTDNDGGEGQSIFQYVVVYDPSGGFVTGGGWIDSPAGAYLPDPSLAGKANFGFVSKYKKGATVPTGQTEFQFHVANLDFHSSSYQWLVVNQAGTNAQYKGSGTINGIGCYKFMLWAGDGDPDTFRIRIWQENEISGAELDVYDNGFEQGIAGGSIVIHTK